MQSKTLPSLNRAQVVMCLFTVLCLLSFSACYGPLKSASNQSLNHKLSSEQTDSDENSLIVPGSSVGKITANTTLADLRDWYGKANVQAGQVPTNEGGTLPGAILFPHDPHKTIKVYWKMLKGQTPTVQSVLIEAPNTSWHTEEGIRVGTSLQQLEKLNGQAFTLSGFDWDYGGMVLSWGDRGKLRDQFQKNGGLSLQLAPSPNASTHYASLEGEGTFSSANPEMQKLNPQVVGLGVFL